MILHLISVRYRDQAQSHDQTLYEHPYPTYTTRYDEILQNAGEVILRAEANGLYVNDLPPLFLPSPRASFRNPRPAWGCMLRSGESPAAQQDANPSAAVAPCPRRSYHPISNAWRANFS
jgi:hypothetical protein